MIYDPEANILSWEIAGGKISHAREFGSLIIHVSSSGKPLLVEILNASKFISQVNRVNSLKDIKKIMPNPGKISI